MRKFLWITIAVLLVNSVYSQTSNESIEEKKNSIGLNVNGLSMFTNDQTNKNVILSLKYYKIKEKYNLRISINHKLNEKEDVYNHYINEENNLTTRTYEESNNRLDARFGLSKNNDIGFGKIKLSFDIILGYNATLTNILENIDYMSNGEVEGFGVSEYTNSEAQFISTGIDFSIAYEINLSEQFALNLEYVPEIVFNSKINEKVDQKNLIPSYKNYLDTDLKVFHLNILYRF